MVPSWFVAVLGFPVALSGQGTRRVSVACFFGLVLSCSVGCSPKIGDECSTATQCNASDRTRICLAESVSGFPGGYCTAFNCSPTSCPEEALCVAYRNQLADAPECGGSGQSGRLRRSYCMLACDRDSDCRDGYACVSVGEDNPWGAEVISVKPGNRKICALPYSDPQTDEDRQNDVCLQRPAETTDADGAAPLGSAPDAAMTVDAAGHQATDAGRLRDAALDAADADAPAGP